MISVKVTCYGNIDLDGLDPDGWIRIDETLTVRQILTRLSLDRRLIKHLPVLIDGELVERSYQPQDGQELVLVAPISGGAALQS